MTVEMTADVDIPTDTSADATVYEDSNGDGSVDNQEQVSLSDGINTYQLDTLNGGGEEYWVQFDLSINDEEVSPLVSSVELDVAEYRNVTAHVGDIVSNSENIGKEAATLTSFVVRLTGQSSREAILTRTGTSSVSSLNAESSWRDTSTAATTPITSRKLGRGIINQAKIL